MPGENSNRQSFLDFLNVMSFFIGVMNLNENLTQGDKQELMESLSKQTQTVLTEIHSHLESQDKKIDEILKRLEG